MTHHLELNYVYLLMSYRKWKIWTIDGIFYYCLNLCCEPMDLLHAGSSLLIFLHVCAKNIFTFKSEESFDHGVDGW